MPAIPDHDGRPATEEHAREMARRLDYIDAVHGGSRYRRALRAAIYRNFGDEQGEAREMGALVMEAGFELGLSARELDRITMPTPMYLTRIKRRPRPN